MDNPIAIDNDFDPNATLVEERIVLFKARSHAEAIRRAEKEAVTYAPNDRINPYGQVVVDRFLDAFDSFELFDPPPSGTPSGLEVFSATEVISAEYSDEDIVTKKISFEDDGPDPRRRKFLDREFSGIVGDPNAHRQKGLHA